MNARTFAAGMIVLHAVSGVLSLAEAQCEPRWVPDSTLGGVAGEFPASVFSAVFHDPDGPGPRDSELYVAGRFVRAGGTAVNSCARWDSVSWKVLNPPPEPYGTSVSQLISTRDGRLVAGGEFTANVGYELTPVGVQVRDHWEPLDPSLRGSFGRLCEGVDGSIYALGSFQIPQHEGTAQLIRVDPRGSVLIPSAADGQIELIAGAPGGGVVACGRFTTIEGAAAPGLARWDGTRWSSLGDLEGGWPAPRVTRLTNMPDGSLVAAGLFTSIGSTQANSLALWDGAAWHALGDAIFQEVTAMSAADDGTLYVAALFIQSGDRSGTVARWDGRNWSIIAADLDVIDVYAVAARDRDRAFVGGSLVSIDATMSRGAAMWEHRRWNSMGGDARFEASAVFSLRGLGATAIGTSIPSLDGQYYHLAQWSADGWRPLDIGMSFWPTSLMIDSQGALLAAADTERWRSDVSVVRRWNGSMWVPVGANLLGSPRRMLLLADGRIVVTGDLVLESIACKVAVWDGTSWHPMGEIAGYTINAAAQMPDGTLIVGGSLWLPGATNSTPLAAWTGERWVDIAAGQITGSCVAMAVLPDGTLMVAGEFSTLSPALRGTNVFGWNESGFHDLALGLDNYWGRFSQIILDIDGMPLVAGSTSPFDGGALGLGRWNGASWEPLGEYVPILNLSRYSWVSSMALHSNGDVLITGASLDGVAALGPRSSLCYSRSPAPRMAQSPASLTINTGEQIVVSASVIMNLDEVSYQWYRNGEVIHDGPGGASGSGGIVRGARGTIAGRTDDSLYTLRITDATPGDAGEYSISFTNPCGGAVSPAATVIVRCLGDFNHDGGIDGSDVDSYFSAWESASLDADTNFDGSIDALDAAEFFTRWADGSC